VTQLNQIGFEIQAKILAICCSFIGALNAEKTPKQKLVGIALLVLKHCATDYTAPVGTVALQTWSIVGLIWIVTLLIWNVTELICNAAFQT
jgi:hypothetical protein